MEFTEKDREDLRRAKMLIEHSSLGARIATAIGSPIENGFALLPTKWSELVMQATRAALRKALDLAVMTMGNRGAQPSSDVMHKIVATAAGAGGGVFGLASLPIELPVATAVMLRSIADIARSEGEEIKSIDARLACVEVFALGGRSTGNDNSETGYFAMRAVLASTVSEAAQFIAESGLVEEGAPAIVRLIAQIASRFGASVSEKAAAQAVPILGAAGGAIVNFIFIDHFQDIARGHFIVRRLERTYGPDVVRAEYERAP